MPIRINLLAEAQAAEEEKRKDPVKRSAYAAGFLVFLVGLWASTLQLKIIASKSDLNTLETKWKSIEKNYQSAVEAQGQSMDAERRLALLQQMSTNRFLWGNVLNGLQQSLNGLDDVQVVRFKSEQNYAVGEETKARTNGTTIIPGLIAPATERISMTIDAMDTSAQAGSHVNSFKESIANVAFFKDRLRKTDALQLTSRSAPQNNPNGKSPFVMFSLQCNFQEKTR
jgi:hypothetical protein